MTPPYPLPVEVREKIREIFSLAGEACSSMMSSAPSTYEETLDMALISAMARHSLPVQVSPGWLVRFQTHYLGGRRHHYNWEIADVGVIVLFRSGGVTRRTKVVLLQSKRLYPIEQDYDELDISDYFTGMQRLTIPDDPWTDLIAGKTLSFTGDSRYRAIARGDRQMAMIADYEASTGIPVHYLMHNPWSVPHQVRTPIEGMPTLSVTPEAGVRVLRSSLLREIGEKDGRFKYSDFEERFTESPRPGVSEIWRLGDFVADLAVECHEGYLANSPSDPGLAQVLANRAGPISAAVSIVIEAPAGV